MKKIIVFLAATALTALVGCSQQEEGPAEKAGKAIDEKMEKAEAYTEEKMEKAEAYTEEKMEKAEAYTDEKMKEMGEAVEKTGEDMQKKE